MQNMKKLKLIIAITAIMFHVKLSAQHDSFCRHAGFRVDTGYAVRVVSAGPCSITIGNVMSYVYQIEGDTTLQIRGDTMKALRILWDMITLEQNKQSTLREEYYDMMRKSVSFTNTVPDIYRIGTKWNEYYAILKKHGYRLVKKGGKNK